MTVARLRTIAVLAIPILAVGEFLVDLITPLGITDWVWYVIPLLFSLYVGGRSLPYVLATVLSILLLVGFFFSPPGIDPGWALISRLAGVLVLWVMALMISQRKQTMAEISKLSRAVEHSPVSIVITDTAGNIEYVNPKFTEVTGYSAPEVIGQNPRVLKSGEIPPGVYQRLWETIIAGREWHGEFHNRKKNGELYWEWASISPICDAAGRITQFLAVKEDITGRKRVEAELRESEARYRSLFENMQEGFAYCRMIYEGGQPRDFIYLTVNQAFEKITGLKEVTGKRVTEVIPGIKESHPELFEIYGRVAAAGRPEQFEIHLESLKMWLAVSVYSPARGYFAAGFENITRRKQAEKVLQTSEKRFRALIENSMDIIVVIAPDGKTLFSSPSIARLFGYQPEELLGRNIFELVHPDDLPKGMAAFQAALLHPRTAQSVEFRFRHRDGSWRVVESIGASFADDPNFAGVIVNSRDVTDRKRTERHLTETLDFNQKIISEAPVGMVVFKASGQCVLANEAAARTLNATVSQILNQDFRQLVSWRNSGMLKMAEEVLATGIPRHGEHHFVSTFGKEVWLICHFSAFVRGDEPHLLLLFNDITERKKLEAQFLRSQRMESLGTLAGGIAHDLNNVLTPLLIAVQVLKEKITDDDGQQLLRALETNVQRGASLVKQVLAFGRGVTGERVMVYPARNIREIKQIVHETFPKSVALEVHSAADLWTIIGDPTQFHQALLNLCVNARDAMPNGGKLSIHMENVVLDEAYAGLNLEARPGPYVCLKVADTGTGIPKEIQDRIFDPFFTTKAPGQGTGLGLSTTLAIVKSHGGFIHLYSEPGKGSTFKIYLPANTTPVDVENAALMQSKLPRGHDELVLVVDDEEPIRNLAQKVLKRFCYRVLLAADGAEAVSIYQSRRNEIALVITDMMMPVMDGPATIVALKAINPEVKIISSSGMASEGGVAKAMAAGVKHFIPKPYTADTLLDTLHEVLQGNPAN